MKAIIRIWKGTSLIVKILVDLALGVLLGILTPQADFREWRKAGRKLPL